MIAAGVGLSVFGFQQSATWGWSNPLIGLCIGAGIVILIIFYFVEVRTPSPLIQVSIFKIRAFLVQNIVLGVTMLVFVPVFFFASEYAQISLGYSASKTGLVLLYFFIGFVITSQIGGRLLDASGAKLPVVLGCVIGAVGFGLWASKMPSLSFSAQQWYIILAGAGVGFMLGPASTDAVNRASKLSYGEATGITQTVRNYAASLGLAILGTILVTEMRNRVTTSLTSKGVPAQAAATQAASISQASHGGSNSNSVAAIPKFVRTDFAYASRTVFYVMAGIMAVAAVVAIIGLQRGVQQENLAYESDAPASGAPGTDGSKVATRPAEPVSGPDIASS